MTIPTDAELQALLPTKQLERNKEPKVQVWLTQKDALEFARAVLAKWGQPQAGAGGVPVGVITGKLGDICQFRSTTMRKGDAVYAAPPPQAVRETLPMPDLTQLTERGATAWAGVDAQALREGGITKGGQHG